MTVQANHSASTSTVTIILKCFTTRHYPTAPELQTQTPTALQIGASRLMHPPRVDACGGQGTSPLNHP
jgi:hypothetical protein